LVASSAICMLLPELPACNRRPTAGRNLREGAALLLTKSIRADSGYGKVASLIRRFKAA
jgi:hypothetical protein